MGEGFERDGTATESANGSMKLRELIGHKRSVVGLVRLRGAMYRMCVPRVRCVLIRGTYVKGSALTVSVTRV